MNSTAGRTLIFSLAEAGELLPQVKHLTADAVRRAESLASQLQGLAQDNPEHVSLSESLRDVVASWADEMRALGLVAKGLWLVAALLASRLLRVYKRIVHLECRSA